MEKKNNNAEIDFNELERLAKYDIYCLINQMVEQGKSVIMISSEMPEILGMCDRIYIMNEGKMAGELDAKEATQEGIMAHIMQNQKK